MESASSGTKWVNEAVRVYKELTDEDKNHFLGNLLQESSFSQLYFLQENLHKLNHRDFIILLPIEIVEHLLTFLDFKSLYNCCQVSRRWNSIISSCHSVWRTKCAQIGLNLSLNETCAVEGKEETYKSMYLSIVNKKYKMHTGQAFKTDTLTGHSRRVTALTIWNKLLASGTEDGEIFIWNTETNKRIDGHKLSEDFCITCISLDGKMLVAGSSTGFMASLSLDLFQHQHLFGQLSAAVFALDFNSHLDLVVSGATDNLVKFWSLSSGRLLRTFHGHHHWVVKIVIRACPANEQYQSNLPDAHLISMDKEKIFVWPIVNSIPLGIDRTIVISLMGCPHGFFTPGLLFDGRYLHFIRQHLDVKTSTMLCSYDIYADRMIQEIRLNTHVKTLLAVGSKYACIITRHSEYREFPSAIVFEKDTLLEVAELQLPLSRTIAPDQPHIAFRNDSWLNGLTGNNTTGIITAVGCENGSISVIKWNT